MTTVYKAKNITKMDASPSRKIASSYVGGRLRVFYDEIELNVSATAGDRVMMARLPVGAVVYDFALAHTALGTGAIALGDFVAVGRYMGVVVVDASNKHTLSINISAIGYKITEETREILIYLNNTTNYIGTVTLTMFYTLD